LATSERIEHKKLRIKDKALTPSLQPAIRQDQIIMADETLAELNQRFGSGAKDLEADVVAELKSMMRMHQLSAQDLFFKWESYGMKMGMDDFKASVDNLRAFKQNLQDALERSNRSQVHIKTEKRAGATPRVAKGGDVFGMLDGLATPGSGRPKPAARRTPAVSRVKAEPASSPMKVEDQLNALGAIPYLRLSPCFLPERRWLMHCLPLP
jgi:DNA polymerase alpha subunit B